MSSRNPEECCPRFVPDPWDETTLTWEDRRFVKDRVTSLFHIPLNFGGVMKRNAANHRATSPRDAVGCWALVGPVDKHRSNETECP